MFVDDAEDSRATAAAQQYDRQRNGEGDRQQQPAAAAVRQAPRGILLDLRPNRAPPEDVDPVHAAERRLPAIHARTRSHDPIRAVPTDGKRTRLLPAVPCHRADAN